MHAMKSKLARRNLGAVSISVVSLLAFGVLQSGAARAETAISKSKTSALALEEIVVTARKREERAVDVPASLNVFTGSDMKASGIATLSDLQYQTPGLKVAVGANSTRITMRGVGTNISSGGPSVAVQMDGIYVPSTRFALAEMFDIGRVEVLKGPEGTLYGRNATGGVINIISRAPGKDFAADGYVGYGSYNLVTAEAGVTIPLDERGGIRVSGTYANDDGYTKNLSPVGGEVDDRNFRGVRLRGQYDLTDALSTDFTVQYSHDKGTVGFGSSNNPDSPVYASIAPQREDPRHIRNDEPPFFDQKGLLLSGTVTLDLGAVTIKSLTGYIDYKYREKDDIDGSGGFIAKQDTHANNKFFSQEFQFSGSAPADITWTAGAYYSHEKFGGRGTETDNDYPIDDPYVYTDQIQSRKNKSYAAFGEVTVPVTQHLSVVAGTRYTKETWTGSSSFDAPLFIPDPIDTSADIKDSAFTPKFLIDFAINDTSKLYASATRGFKSGGANLTTDVNVYKPEKIWAYEAGYKTSVDNGRAELSLAGFYYDYTDLQLKTVLFTPTGIITKITNAAKASIYGLEASGVYSPVDGLTLDFNGAYLDTELKNFISPVTLEQVKGLPLPLAPKWSFTTGVQHEADLANLGTLTARIEVTYQSQVNFPQFADFDRERQDGYALLNANVRYDTPDRRFYVALIGRNLTDKLYKTQRFYYEGFADEEFYGAPRTIEVRLGFNF